MWWKQHLEEFPHLDRMTRHLLVVPSVSPERLFISVGFVKSDVWGRVLDITFATLIDVMWGKQTP